MKFLYLKMFLRVVAVSILIFICGENINKLKSSESLPLVSPKAVGFFKKLTVAGAVSSAPGDSGQGIENSTDGNPATYQSGKSDDQKTTPVTASKISILGGYATTDAAPDGNNVPANVLDGNLNSYWRGNGVGKWINLNMDAEYDIDYVKLAFYNPRNARRTYKFDIEVSLDSLTWITVVSNGYSSPNNTALETFDFTDITAKYVRVVGYGNTVNDWNSYREIEIWGKPTHRPQVISDWESGDFSQWQGIRATDTAAQLSVVTTPVRQGKYAAKFVVRPHDTLARFSGERCEISHYSDIWNGYTQEAPDDDYYYGWSTYIPTDWTNPQLYGIFMQWHSRTSINPPIAFNIGGDSIGVSFRTGIVGGVVGAATYTYKNYFVISRDLYKGLWQDFIVRVKFRPDDTGIVQVWHRVEGQSRFRQIFSLANIPTLQYFSNLSLIDSRAEISIGSRYTTKCYIQHGLYRDKGGSNTNTIYHDNWTRGASYSAVRSTFP
ncbi:MAG TPA: heparin lyase I family protein [Flavitalea sp.]|nr:heparin lyase I family protein [Flavitalea sp.]